MTFTMGSRTVGGDEPTYFIADIAANHDGELDRAVELVRLAAEAGADAAKFQNFSAAGIVSDYGFKALGGQQSHQASWEKSVFEVYADASIPADWTPVLKQACDDAGIDYFSAPYDLAAIDMLEPYVPAYKVGSGDVDWLGLDPRDGPQGQADAGRDRCGHARRRRRGRRGGARDQPGPLPDAVQHQLHRRPGQHALPQPAGAASPTASCSPTWCSACPTTRPATSASSAPSRSAPASSRSTSPTTPQRVGPDHKFSMDPATWRAMVDSARDLESALGSPLKKVEDNETRDRRPAAALPARRSRPAGRHRARPPTTSRSSARRPPARCRPAAFDEVVGRTVRHDLVFGQELTWSALD